MCVWGSIDNDLPISNPLTVSHKKTPNLFNFFLIVAHSLLMHLFLLHFAVVQSTVDLLFTRLDEREKEKISLQSYPHLSQYYLIPGSVSFLDFSHSKTVWGFRSMQHSVF